MKLSLVQLCILAVLFSPENKRAWENLRFRERNQKNHKRWRQDNHEHLKGYMRDWAKEKYKKNPSAANATCRLWKSKNRDKIRPAQNRWKKARWDSDPSFRLREGMRSRVRLALERNTKSGPTLELLGCTIPELRAHLESLFRPGMSWENYGPVWHVDHKRPCASFDLANPAQQRECFHWTNLQPLFAEENLQKGSKCVR